LTSIASIFNFILGFALLAIGIWAYVRFSGEIREIGCQLDNAAEWIWDEVFMTVYSFAVQQGTQAMLAHQISRTTKKDN